MNAGQYAAIISIISGQTLVLTIFFICVYKKVERIQKIIEELKAKIEKEK